MHNFSFISRHEWDIGMNDEITLQCEVWGMTMGSLLIVRLVQNGRDDGLESSALWIG